MDSLTSHDYARIQIQHEAEVNQYSAVRMYMLSVTHLVWVRVKPRSTRLRVPTGGVPPAWCASAADSGHVAARHSGGPPPDCRLGHHAMVCTLTLRSSPTNLNSASRVPVEKVPNRSMGGRIRSSFQMKPPMPYTDAAPKSCCHLFIDHANFRPNSSDLF